MKSLARTYATLAVAIFLIAMLVADATRVAVDCGNASSARNGKTEIS